MFLTIVGPVGYEETAAIANRGMSLGTLLGKHIEAVEGCFVNNVPMIDWKKYIPQKADRIKLQIRTAIDYISAGTAIAMAVSLAVSAISTGLSYALAAKPAKADGRQSEAFGISGFQNTTGQGTPIPVWYGQNRVTPHIIAGGIDVSADHKNMTGRILYCVGDSGGDTYQSLSDVLIDDVPISQYEGCVGHARLGGLDQDIIPEFENASTPWFVGTSIPWSDDTRTGTPITYRTKSDQINRVGLSFSFPSGLWRVNSSGKNRADVVSMQMWYKRANEPDTSYVLIMPGSGWWVGDNTNFHFEDRSQSELFYKVIVDLPLPGDQWDIKFLITGSHMSFPVEEPHSTTLQLFNVEEITYTTVNYGGYVLLGLTGIPAKQVRSLQSLKVSVMVNGKLVKVPDGQGNYVKRFTRERCWIVRDMLTGPCGMDYEFTEAEIDDQQWLVESQDYYNDYVSSHQGSPDEIRDYCDVGINERRWDWEWVRSVAGEGRGCIIPSGEKWKYIIDKPGTPNLLLSEPGNIIENSIQMQIGPPEEDPYNQILAEYRDETDDYHPQLTPPIYADPLNPPPSIIQKVVHYDTIIRESQAIREVRIVIKRQFSETKRWQFVTPGKMLVSEPLDIDWLAERKLGNVGAYTGILRSGSTQSLIVLPEVVELKPATNYFLIIQHRDNSPAENRAVTNAPGRWVEITISSPLTDPPNEGDLYALGETLYDYIQTRLRDITIDAEGRISQVRSLYDETIYNEEEIAPKAIRRKFGYSNVPPVPLWDAGVVEEIVEKRDGTQGSVLLFDVTPGFISHTGAIQGIGPGGPHQIVLEEREPANSPFVENIYRNAWVELIDGPCAGEAARIVTDYWAASRTLSFSPVFSGTPVVGNTYRIFWTKFSDCNGFKLETSNDITWSEASFIEIARVTGFHFERDGGDQGGTWYYRFTPLNVSGVENKAGQIVKGITLTGDHVAPPEPSLVASKATLKLATTYVYLPNGMPLDFAGVDIEIYRFQWVGGNRQIIDQIGAHRVAAPQNSGQTMQVFHTFDISVVANMSYSDLLFARARSVDFSNNSSAWTEGAQFSPRQTDTADYGPDSIMTISHFENLSANIVINAHGAEEGKDLLAYVTLTTIGGSIDVGARATIPGAGPESAEVRLYLKVGALDYITAREVDRCSYGTEFNLWAVDEVPAGTWTYSCWGEVIGGSGPVSCTAIRIKAQENRGGIVV